MLARQVVLLVPSKSSAPTQLLSRQHFVRVSPLAATFMHLPASVANKRLTVELTPLAATLTKNRGEAVSSIDVPTFGRLDGETFRRSPLSFFASRVFHNSFAIKGFHTLSQNCRVYTNSSQNGTCRPAYRGQDNRGHRCALRLFNSSTLEPFNPSTLVLSDHTSAALAFSSAMYSI